MPDEEEAIRIELAIALGQYASDASFQALCLALDDRSLAINLAAADSLRVMTGRDFGLDALPSGSPGTTPPSIERRSVRDRGDVPLSRSREIGFVESLAFWRDTSFEKPAIAASRRGRGRPTTTNPHPIASTRISARGRTDDPSGAGGEPTDRESVPIDAGISPDDPRSPLMGCGRRRRPRSRRA